MAAGSLSGQAAVPLEVTPDSVVLRPGSVVPVVVTVTNTGNLSLTALALSAFSAEPVTVEITDSTVAGLAPGEMHAWSARVRASAQSRFTGSAHFRLDYRQGASATSPGTSRVSLVELKARANGLPVPDSVVTVQVQTSLQSLTEGRPGLVHLVMENKHTSPLDVGPVTATGPSFVTFSDTEALTIALNESQSVTIVATAADRVQPGNQVLLFRVPIRWAESGTEHSASVIVSHQVDVGVFGESEILGILGTVGVGIPSFLLLPGFLILITLWVMWRVGVLRPGYTRPTLAADGIALAKMPEFWASAITLSLLMAVLYPLFPGGRSYLESYGLRDIVNVWMISVFAVGVAGYLTVGLFFLVRRKTRDSNQRKQAAAQALVTPAAADDELETLAKLGRRSLPLRRPHWTIQDGGQSGLAFVVDGDVNADPVWVAPAIHVSFTPQTDPATQQTIMKHLQDDSDPEALRQALVPAIAAGKVTVAFREVGSFRGPTQKPRSDLSGGGESAIADRA